GGGRLHDHGLARPIREALVVRDGQDDVVAPDTRVCVGGEVTRVGGSRITEIPRVGGDPAVGIVGGRRVERHRGTDDHGVRGRGEGGDRRLAGVPITVDRRGRCDPYRSV